MSTAWVITEVGWEPDSRTYRQTDERELVDALEVAREWIEGRRKQGYFIREVNSKMWELEATNLVDLSIYINSWVI